MTNKTTTWCLKKQQMEELLSSKGNSNHVMPEEIAKFVLWKGITKEAWM